MKYALIRLMFTAILIQYACDHLEGGTVYII